VTCAVDAGCGTLTHPRFIPVHWEPLMEGQQQINEVHNHQDSTVPSILWI